MEKDEVRDCLGGILSSAKPHHALGEVEAGGREIGVAISGERLIAIEALGLGSGLGSHLRKLLVLGKRRNCCCDGKAVLFCVIRYSIDRSNGSVQLRFFVV